MTMLSREELTKYMVSVIGSVTPPFDYRTLERSEWSTYYADAQSIINSPVFNNVINGIIENLKNNVIMYAKSYEELAHARSYVLALEELRNQLESVEKPPSPDSVDDPYSAT